MKTKSTPVDRPEDSKGTTQNPFIKPFNETIRVEVDLDEIVAELEDSITSENAKLIAHVMVGIAKNNHSINKLYSAMNGRLGLNPKFHEGQKVYYCGKIYVENHGWKLLKDAFRIESIDYFTDSADISIIDNHGAALIEKRASFSELSEKPFDMIDSYSYKDLVTTKFDTVDEGD